MDDAFAFLHELLDEMAQTKFFGVDLGHQGAFPWDACSMNAAILPVRHDTVQQQVRSRSRKDDTMQPHGSGPCRYQDVSAAAARCRDPDRSATGAALPGIVRSASELPGRPPATGTLTWQLR
jgi:hypothetical protein